MDRYQGPREGRIEDHLNRTGFFFFWTAIRVRPGGREERGEFSDHLNRTGEKPNFGLWGQGWGGQMDFYRQPYNTFYGPLSGSKRGAN